MRNELEKLLDLDDPITKQKYNYWDKVDCSDVGLCEILLEQLVRKHKKQNGSYYDITYDSIKLRYDNI